MTQEMELIKETIEYAKEGSKILKDVGAVSVIKTGTKSLFSYLGSLLKEGNKKPLEAIEEDPTNDKAATNLEFVLENAITNETEIAALKAEIEKFKALLAEHKPTTNSNVQTRISNSKNVIVGSTIGNVGGNFRVGDNITKGK